jgi:hypothetical protein
MAKLATKKASKKGTRGRGRPRGSKNNCVVRRGRKESACKDGKVCDTETKRCRAPKARGRPRASKSGSKRASKRASKSGSKGHVAYCLSCRQHVNVVDPFYTLKKTGARVTRLLKGTCPEGHNVSKIVSKEEYDAA